MTRLASLCIVAVAVAACSSGPSKEESLQIYAAASGAMSSARARAVDDARASAALAAPAELALDYAGRCSLGGTITVRGSHAAEGNGDRAAFDLTATFSACHELTGTLDGQLRWASVADGSGFRATMAGELDWKGSDGDASCDFDLALEIDAIGIRYAGSLCGHDVGAELVIGPRS